MDGEPVSFPVMNEGAEETDLHWIERLYRLKSRELLLYGRALGLSHGEAEDVLQETFLALMQMERGPDHPEHYCIRSYRNRALNYRRSFWRRVARELESRRWFERGEAGQSLEEAAMHCLASLPGEQREVIVLKIWHGCTFQEIGELIEVSPNTVAGRYRYGMRKIRSVIEDIYERIEFGEPDAKMETAFPIPQN